MTFERSATPVAVLLTLFCGACTDALPTGEHSSLADDGEGVSAAKEAPTAATPVAPEAVDTLFDSSTSGLRSARRQVVRTPEEWTGVWTEIMNPWLSEDLVPEVDFSSQQVIVLASGERPTGGYDLDVRSIAREGDTLYVIVEERSPGPDCVTSQALTRPALALRVPRHGGTVAFIEEESVGDCG